MSTPKKKAPRAEKITNVPRSPDVPRPEDVFPDEHADASTVPVKYPDPTAKQEPNDGMHMSIWERRRRERGER